MKLLQLINFTPAISVQIELFGEYKDFPGSGQRFQLNTPEDPFQSVCLHFREGKEVVDSLHWSTLYPDPETRVKPVMKLANGYVMTDKQRIRLEIMAWVVMATAGQLARLSVATQEEMARRMKAA